MMLALEATDVDYLERLTEGPYIPMKLVPAYQEEGKEIAEHYIPKLKSEWNAEDKVDVLKDAKVRNLLHNGLDPVMSNRVISCKTAKQIWDTLEIQCSGTEKIKKNRRNILVQEYEYFAAKSGESLTEVYDRFLKLLNDLALVDKEYPNEDSNSKFMSALPEEWDVQTSIIRDRSDLNDLSLDEVYGRLKTYELELQQRRNRRNVKSKQVALKAEIRPERKRTSASRKEKEIQTSDSEEESPDQTPDESSDISNESPDDDAEIEELVAMFAKGVKKIAFRNFNKNNNRRRFDSKDKDAFKKKDNKDLKSKSIDKSKVKCYKCEKLGHYATECRNKGKTLITSTKGWMDSSESEEEVNYALMAKVETPEKVLHPVFNIDIDDICELKRFLKHLHLDFKNQSQENSRLKSEISALKERNCQVELELKSMNEIQKKHDLAIIRKDALEIRNKNLEEKLKEKEDLINRWQKSGKKLDGLMGNEEAIYGLGFKEKSVKQIANKFNDSFDKIEYEMKHMPGIELKKKTRFILPSEKSNKLKEERTQISRKKALPEIGLLKQKELKWICKEKKNRNGKIGVSRNNQFLNDPNTSRKTCYICGSSHHLAFKCNQRNINKRQNKRSIVTRKIQKSYQNNYVTKGTSRFMYVIKHDKRNKSIYDSNQSTKKVSAAKRSKEGPKLVWAPKTSN